MRIAVVAPSSRFEPGGDRAAGGSTAIAAARHPGRRDRLPPAMLPRLTGHFAGTDDERAAALVEVANDPAVDAVWFARGGYGSCRIAEQALAGCSAGGAGQGLARL